MFVMHIHCTPKAHSHLRFQPLCLAFLFLSLFKEIVIGFALLLPFIRFLTMFILLFCPRRFMWWDLFLGNIFLLKIFSCQVRILSNSHFGHLHKNLLKRFFLTNWIMIPKSVQSNAWSGNKMKQSLDLIILREQNSKAHGFWGFYMKKYVPWKGLILLA